MSGRYASYWNAFLLLLLLFCYVRLIDLQRQTRQCYQLITALFATFALLGILIQLDLLN